MPRETVTEEPDPGGGTYRLELVRCGKPACNSCPHGPYWYRYYRVGRRVVSKYVGKDRAGATTTRRGNSATGAADSAAQVTATADADLASPAPASGQTAPESATAPAAGRQAKIRTQVREAVRGLMTEPHDPWAGEFVGLADLREKLSGITRAELDAELARMYRAQEINLIPRSSGIQTTDADRAAAIHMGGEDKHLVSIPQPAPAGLADTGPEAVRAQVNGDAR
jgi:hypothetical protein